MKLRKEEKNEDGEFLRSGDFEIGTTLKLRVEKDKEVDFTRADEESDPRNVKVVLIGETLEGTKRQFVLNWVNTQYLEEKGVNDTDQLIGKTLTIKKEARILENNKGRKFDSIGLFIVDIEFPKVRK
ncbi:MAG: hypothetical protein ACYDC6_14275 [Acidobacteriaceae bacterium]